MTEEEIAVKFNAIGKSVIGEEPCNQLRQLIMIIESEESLDGMMRLTRV